MPRAVAREVVHAFGTADVHGAEVGEDVLAAR
jgi:hypothetical protein